MLKASARNCKLYFSLKLNFLNSEVSKLVSPGPVNDPRATFLKIPAFGVRKARGSHHCSGFPVATGPLKLGFKFGTSGFWVAPVPELSAPTRVVEGKPL